MSLKRGVVLLPRRKEKRMSTGFDRIRQAKEAARQAEAEVQAAVKAMTRTFRGVR
jgi:hypothetical protein